MRGRALSLSIALFTLLVLSACEQRSSPSASFQISTSHDSISLAPGGTTAILISAHREPGDDAPVTIELAGLPAGITAPGVTLDTAHPSRLLEFQASLEATLTDASITVRGVSSNGTVEKRLTLRLVEPQSSEQLIKAALEGGEIDEESAILYRIFADFGNEHLPEAFRGNANGHNHGFSLRGAAEAWERLTASAQETARPYFVPPVYEESAFAPEHGSATNTQRLLASETPPECTLNRSDDVWDRLTTAHFNIWYLQFEGMSAEWAAEYRLAAENIAKFAEEIYGGLTTHFSRHPLTDEAEACNGGDGAIDIYVYNFNRKTYEDPASGLKLGFDTLPPTTISYRKCTNAPAFIIYPTNHAQTETQVKAALSHEIWHLIEFSHHLLNCRESEWLAEATGNWATNFMYPDSVANFEHWPIPTYYREDLGIFAQPLSGPSGDPSAFPGGKYVYYPVLFFLSNHLGDAVIKNIWDNAEVYHSLHAIDRAVAGGFRAVWHEFARHSINRTPVQQFQTWDGVQPGFAKNGKQEPIPLDLEGAATGKVVIPGMGLPGLASQYDHYRITDEDVKKIEVTVPRPSTASNPDVRIQAWIKLENGQARLEDWTERDAVTLCRENPAERATEILIVYSNSTIETHPMLLESFSEGALSLSRAPCLSYDLSLDYRVSRSHPDVSFPDETLHVTGTIADEDPEGAFDLIGSGTYSGQIVLCEDPPTAYPISGIADLSLEFWHETQQITLGWYLEPDDAWLSGAQVLDMTLEGGAVTVEWTNDYAWCAGDGGYTTTKVMVTLTPSSSN